MHTFGDAHIYKNSIDQVKEQRTESLKTSKINYVKSYSIDEQERSDDFVLDGYESHPALKAPMAI